MKHGKKPTVRQKDLIKSLGLNHLNWLVVKHTPTEFAIVHKENRLSREYECKDCEWARRK